MKEVVKKSEKSLSSVILRGRLKHAYELIFIDWNTFFIIIAIILINFLLFAPSNLTFCFPKLDIQINIIETLSRIISVFLGIIFSLIVLSFNIFNKYFGRFVFSILFKSKTIKFLFTLFVCTLTFLIYSLSYFKVLNEADSYSNSLFVLSILFSIIIVFSVFPVAKTLLKNSQNRANVNSIISKLNGRFDDVEFVYSSSDIQIIASPMITLIEIGTISIKDYDYTTIGVLASGIEGNFKSIVDKQENQLILKGLYRQSNHILFSLFPIASKERNENALNKIVNTRFNIEKYTIENIDKIKLTDFENKYQGWEFNNTFQDFFNRANQFNEDSVCKLIIDRYRDFLSEIITSYLPGRYDHLPNDWQKYKNETSLINHLFSEPSKFVGIMVASKKHHYYQNIANLSTTLELTVLASTNTVMAKVYLLKIINSWKYDSFETYLTTSGVNQVEMLNFPFSTLSDTQSLTDIKCDIPLLYTIKATDLLFAQNRLNSMAINSLKALGFFLIQNLNENDINKKLLIIIIKEFEKLGSYIKPSDSDYKKDIYVKLDKYLDYIIKYSNDLKLNDSEINNAFQKAKVVFNNTATFVLELREKGYVSNDKII